MNTEFKTKAHELEQRVQEAHDRYVKSKGKGRVMSQRRHKKSTHEMFNDANNCYTSGKQSVRDGRNLSMCSSTKNEAAGNRSHSSSYGFLHLTKDLESIYKEFEAGEMNELNKLRRLVSHFRGLSRRTQV